MFPAQKLFSDLNSCPSDGPSHHFNAGSATNIPPSASPSATTYVAIANNVGALGMKSSRS